MLLELLQKGYGKAMNLNCAEKILYGANWAYNMQLPPQALKIAAGFGGGMAAVLPELLSGLALCCIGGMGLACTGQGKTGND